jgi:hypothetical protein
MTRPLFRATTFAFVLAASGFALAPAFASIPERTDAVPTPAIDPGFPFVTSGGSFSLPPQFVDFDLDGKSDILAVDNLGVIYALGPNAQPLGGWPRSVGDRLSGPPAVGDLDLDGIPDLAVVTRRGLVWTFASNGVLRAVPYQLPGTPIGGPVLAELDATGRLAIVVATTDGKLHAINADGNPIAGWPVTGPGPAIGGAFTFIAGDNFPRVGYLAQAGGAVIYFTYAALDAANSYDPGVPLGPAMPVSGARKVTGLSDIDQLYLAGRGGQLWRFDPDVIGMGGDPIALAPVLGDSIVDTPGLVDLTADLIPELAVRSLRGDTLSITVIDGAAGSPLIGFPRKYLNSAPGGAILAADLGDGATPELVFNQGGDKVTCITSNGTPQWTLTGLPAKAGPALGDLDGDGALDLAVATTDGKIYAYTLGNGGIGPRGVEWPNSDGQADHSRRHHVRDRAAVRPQWPAPLTPPEAFTARPLIADLTGDGLPEAVWSDYVTSKTYAWNQATSVAPGWPQTYANGAINDAPAVGDVTGDGVFETVQSTTTGWLVWGDKTGATGSLLIDLGKILTPPALADLDGDGTLDVVVGSSSGRLYGVNLVTRAVIAGFPVTTAGAIVLPPALGDITGDGQTDIVVVAGLRYIYAYGKTGGAPLAGWPRQFPSGSSLTQPILVPVAGNSGLAVSFGQARADSVLAHLVGGNSTEKAGWPKTLAGTLIFGPVAGDFNNDGAPDFVFSTGNLIASNPGADSVYVFVANGNRALYRLYSSPGNVEVSGMVDLDLDQRPDIIAISDRSTIFGIRFNGLVSRAFDRLVFFLESGQPPAFGDLGNDGVMEMALSDLGSPILYSFGFGSWNAAWAPWPMKGHDPKRTNAFSGLTVVGVGDSPPAPVVTAGWARALPNPAAGRVALTHSRPLAGRFEAAIFDLRGRLVRRVAAGEARVGDSPPTWTWDGADDAGRATAAGVYFYRVVDQLGALSTRVVRLR